MASLFKNAWRTATNAEQELLRRLAEKEPTFAEISQLLSEFRTACQNAILSDFDTARTLDVEGRLWEAHLKLNNRFRKLLARYREETTKKRPVEKRKLEKHYLDFIKSSQRFYRGYIQHLSSQFGGIVELEKVAHKFNFESLSSISPTTITPELRLRILQSCHATLIRLGDLSRYRETELASHKRNWGPAIGYYDLASVIYPASGASHNQLAVIALADGNHFRATYHLYRALSAHNPHPSAKGNLEIEFKKVMNAWAKRELIRPEDQGVPGKALAPWFVYLHAQCYRGLDFPEHEELESEVMSQLAVDVRERSHEGTLQKFCLVNIAAEEFARARSTEESVSHARMFFQRINVKTFFTLLQILLVELERFAGDESINSSQASKNGPDKVTVVARRILPALRHYSSWLLVTSDYLLSSKEEQDSSLAIQIQEFWKIYAGTLTLLASTFDVVHLPEVDYLLEEDEESLGFAPLDQPATSRRYVGQGDCLKPRMNDPGVERSHPNIEMLYRIREFVIDGLDLVVRSRIPVTLVDEEDKKTFIYQEDGLPSQFFSSPLAHPAPLIAPAVEREDIPPAGQNPVTGGETRSTYGDAQSVSASACASMSVNMHRIAEDVDRLVESDTYENAPNVPDQFAFLRDSARIPAPSARPPANLDAFNFNNEMRAQQLSTPLLPPGLGAPSVQISEALRTSAGQSYNPLPTLPSIPSIWNTSTSTPLRDDATSSRTPPGLGPPAPAHSPNALDANRVRSPVADQAANDLLRHSLMAQSQLPSSQEVSSSMPLWLQFTNSQASNQWPADPRRFSYAPGQSVSNGFPTQSWPNEAFIASSFAPGAGPLASGFNNHRKSATQLGAIGQTPPCGQGG
ncbi:Uncharacterized protein PECH_003499 [Penicillium ucsense]|uniref:Nonsense-mediated mRNA decay factor n=1 Tax=Penicillium ucsense TaxID=2839758 RepID=A0A8J8W7N7_9EURO|nr:Uncharacterized protein PECM_005511 [Penicillium ucsense]KAF7737580.1 Uncharacterized protein PECH_003499 [Penicillium ucsense]